MKYFSDVTKEVYETPEDLQAAEAAAMTALEDTDDDVFELTEGLKVEIPKESKKPSKKQLAADVEDAEKNLEEANSNLALAEKEVEKLSLEYLKICEDILRPAKQKVQEAQKAKYNAISRFNQEYGAYQVLYTGSRAANEMIRAINEMNARTANMFKHFWF